LCFTVCVLLVIAVVRSVEYDSNGNIVYDDYNLEYEIDDDQYFVMSIAALLLWTLGSVFIGIVVCGGGLLWYKMYVANQVQMQPKWQPPSND